ncbi:MAG: hypothetical protein P1Q69_11440 [Candidatus Thorarchaeota archaeon]|nr:hypothetical protein [Candidatus Thorarchaeota archaeon]
MVEEPSFLTFIATLILFGTLSFVNAFTPGYLGPLTAIPVYLSLLAGILAFYGGHLAEKEIEEDNRITQNNTSNSNPINLLD